jgi:hypothetical protein
MQEELIWQKENALHAEQQFAEFWENQKNKSIFIENYIFIRSKYKLYLNI